MKTNNNLQLSILMWLVPLSFFTYQFILRLWPSLTMQQVMLQFGIDASSYGLLASIYYYGYAGMQIPIAIALDKYGPKYILTICALLCGGGMYLSVNSNIWEVVLMGRFMIGVGSAGGFLSTSKVISQRFPSDSYSKMVGFSFSIGLLGAVYGGRPTSELVQAIGWERVGNILTFVALAIAAVAFLLLRNGERGEEDSQGFQMKDIISVVKSPRVLLLAIANLLLVGSLEGFADVWGVNYLVAAYGIDKTVAAEVVSLIPVGMIFGGPILAFFSKKLGEYLMIFICGLVMALSIIYLLYFSMSFDKVILGCIFFLIGVMCCYQVLVFSLGTRISSQDTLSLTIAFLNCVNMLGGAFFHTLIGNGIDLYGTSVNGIYSVESYRIALLIIPICATIGSFIMLFSRKGSTSH
jgi:predicted MFS family arabinose efflux permease